MGARISFKKRASPLLIIQDRLDYNIPNDLATKEQDGAHYVPVPPEEEMTKSPEVHLALDELSSKKTFAKGQRKHFVSEVKDV